jgi:hypothetical protein
LVMSTMILPASASPYWLTTGTALSNSTARMTISPAGAAPHVPAVAPLPSALARAAALAALRPITSTALLPWTDGGALHSLGTTPSAAMRRSPGSRNYRRVVVNFPSHHIRIAGYRLPRLPDSNVCCAQSTKDVQAMSGLAARRASMSTR